MEIRHARVDERGALLDLLESVFEERAAFALQMESDPAFREDDILVAFEGVRPVSCVQIFGKQVRCGDITLPLGGIGSVATDPEFRGRGLASNLMRRQTRAMAERGYTLGLLFTGRITFYEPLGWVQCPMPQVAVRRPAVLDEGPARLRPFRPSDLPQVRALYDRYSANLAGTTLRDDADWASHLRYATSEDERFRVAELDGEVIAYARTGRIGVVCALEYARGPTAADALAQLIVSLVPRSGALLLRTTRDPEFRDALGIRAARVDPLPDPTPMWRVLDRARLAPLVGAGEALPDADVIRALVSERALHFWLSDRF